MGVGAHVSLPTEELTVEWSIAPPDYVPPPGALVALLLSDEETERAERALAAAAPLFAQAE